MINNHKLTFVFQIRDFWTMQSSQIPDPYFGHHPHQTPIFCGCKWHLVMVLRCHLAPHRAPVKRLGKDGKPIDIGYLLTVNKQHYLIIWKPSLLEYVIRMHWLMTAWNKFCRNPGAKFAFVERPCRCSCNTGINTSRALPAVVAETTGTRTCRKHLQIQSISFEECRLLNFCCWRSEVPKNLQNLQWNP